MWKIMEVIDTDFILFSHSDSSAQYQQVFYHGKSPDESRIPKDARGVTNTSHKYTAQVSCK